MTVSAFSQAPSAPPPGLPIRALPGTQASANIEQDTVNYLIRVEWKTPAAESKAIEVLTAEGPFDLNTMEKNPVKINGNDVPTTLKFSGSITAIGGDKARVKLFLGRTVPYITSTSSNGGANSMSSYQQMQVGLNSTFLVKFDKSVVIQNDENGQISVLVKRQE